MTAYINKLKDKTGNQQLPVTHERAVRDDNGTTAETKFQNLEGAMDKAYVASSDNGMGRITLKKNMVSGVNTLTQSMMQATNTIYVIRYDFTLTDNVNIPANCVLEFDGGSISGNGTGKDTITGTDTQIVAPKTSIFTGITIVGTWNVPYITSDWFSDAENENVLEQIFNLTSDTMQNTVSIENGTYEVSVGEYNKSALIPASNTHVYITGTIQMLPNGFTKCSIFDIPRKNNITIDGSGQLVGDVMNHDFETNALTLGTKVLCTNASNTPKGATLFVGDTQIEGTLEASQDLIDNVYWVRANNDPNTPTKYIYYKVVDDSGTYVFDIVNTHEGCHGIRVNKSNNVTIRGIDIKLFPGDGIVVGSNSEFTENTVIDGVSIEKCRRQGISLVGGVQNIVVRNFYISYIGDFSENGIYVVGTKPKDGIDIEPTFNSEPSKNIIIENGFIQNVGSHGIMADNLGLDYGGTTSIEDVVVENIYIKDSLDSPIAANDCEVTFKNIKAICEVKSVPFVAGGRTGVGKIHIDNVYFKTVGTSTVSMHYLTYGINCSLLEISNLESPDYLTVRSTHSKGTIKLNNINKIADIVYVGEYVSSQDLLFDLNNVEIDGNYSTSNYFLNIRGTLLISNSKITLGNKSIYVSSKTKLILRQCAIESNQKITILSSSGPAYFYDVSIPDNFNIRGTGDYLSALSGRQFENKTNIKGIPQGHCIFDDALGKPLFWKGDGAYWVDANGTRVTWNIIFNLTNVVSSSYLEPDVDKPYTVTLSAEEGYTLPNTVTIKMDGNTLSANTDYTYDSSTGEIVILGSGGTGGVTGDVNIKAVGTSLLG